MANFKRWNNITGWFVFGIAATVYLLTLEPTVSYWDCGEFIASAYKLEVNHPPGAPLFLMLAKVFSILAPDKTKVALMINTLSALVSAFTIMFLFWTITRLSQRLFRKNSCQDNARAIAILGAGLVGALAYTFTDTFWFSAVEAEVYATSSLFTAVVFWAILKWEEQCDESFGNRWIVLIAYLIGLSIGVHLLNLLAIPAIALVFYFRKFKATWGGFSLAILISLALLAFVLFGIISGLPDLGAKIEIWCVNSLKMPFNAGIIGFFILIGFVLTGGIWITLSVKKPVFNIILLGILMIMAGYSSYLLIVIRSSANPPMNENRPDNVLSYVNYINRDQYEDTPLLYGPYFNAPVAGISVGKPILRKEHNSYVAGYRKSKYKYDRRFMTIFPRMYSTESDHSTVYKSWGNIKGTPITYIQDKVQKIENKPTFKENLLFFFKYQIGYMYFRYFGWNFIGRQNNIDGDGGVLYGNCISGVGFIDSIFYGPQNLLPDRFKKNKGRNCYYFLPFLLGLLGAIYQFRKNKQDFAVVSMLFFMTGIAIVIYLNQSPLQVRERDYAYAGSFYAFSIWIGLGVLFLSGFFNRKLGYPQSAFTATILSLLSVPVLMAVENWNDHDRSHRFTAHDVAYNYLNSCAPDAILFTNGDNDTFPLWYLQEVESVRTDIRVVNVLLLSFDWYIDQMKRKIYNSDPLPISLSSEKYREGNCDFVFLSAHNSDFMNIREAISFVASNDTSKKIVLTSGEVIDCIPASKFRINVDTSLVISNHTVDRSLQNNILPVIDMKFSYDYLSKNELIILDILANNNWQRPIYYLSPNAEGSLGLGNYTQLEGFAYRLVPLYTKREDKYRTGRIETSLMYHRFMKTFRWGNMNEKDVLIDDQNLQTAAILKIRVNFSRLAEQLYFDGHKDSARNVIERCVELMPSDIYPHDIYSLVLAEAAYKVQDTTVANNIVQEYAEQCFQDLTFFHSMSRRQSGIVDYEENMDSQIIHQLYDLSEKYGHKWLKEKLLLQSRQVQN